MLTKLFPHYSSMVQYRSRMWRSLGHGFNTLASAVSRKKQNESNQSLILRPMERVRKVKNLRKLGLNYFFSSWASEATMKGGGGNWFGRRRWDGFFNVFLKCIQFRKLIFMVNTFPSIITSSEASSFLLLLLLLLGMSEKCGTMSGGECERFE